MLTRIELKEFYKDHGFPHAANAVDDILRFGDPRLIEYTFAMWRSEPKFFEFHGIGRVSRFFTPKEAQTCSSGSTSGQP